jgi:hypothetical protein
MNAHNRFNVMLYMPHGGYFYGFRTAQCFRDTAADYALDWEYRVGMPARVISWSSGY